MLDVVRSPWTMSASCMRATATPIWYASAVAAGAYVPSTQSSSHVSARYTIDRQAHAHELTGFAECAAKKLLDAAAADLLGVQSPVLFVNEVDARRDDAGFAALDDAPRFLHEAPVRELLVEHRQAVALLHALFHNARAASEERLVHFLHRHKKN